VTGGSSSGNGAALATGMGALALGTDTGGSCACPPAGCEVVGLKTPFGAIATDGVFPLVPDLDTVGPMARTVEDCALALVDIERRAGAGAVAGGQADRQAGAVPEPG
jgi:Asp-tRNA(Asn)/Glu-tRNA(Gln) amidotransferase A subunit family amidase